jgi:hypothetical protein
MPWYYYISRPTNNRAKFVQPSSAALTPSHSPLNTHLLTLVKESGNNWGTLPYRHRTLGGRRTPQPNMAHNSHELQPQQTVLHCHTRWVRLVADTPMVPHVSCVHPHAWSTPTVRGKSRTSPLTRYNSVLHTLCTHRVHACTLWPTHLCTLGAHLHTHMYTLA